MNVRLFDYQVNAINFVLAKKRALLALEMGMGKTLIGVEIVKILNTKFVVVTPKAILQQGADQLGVKLPKKYTQAYIDTQQIVVINYELFFKFKFTHTNFIFDECHRLKNLRSQAFKHAFAVTRTAEYVLLLSGTPYPQGYKDCFYLFYFFENKFFPYSFFENNFIEYALFSKIKIIEGYKNVPELLNYLNTHSLFLKNNRLLPDQNYFFINYEYSKFVNFYLKNKCVMINKYAIYPALSVHFKAQALEVINGFYRKLLFNENKLLVLKNLLLNLNRSVIIFYNFKSECFWIKKYSPFEFLEINGQKNELTIFLNTNKTTVLLCQYNSAAEAIDGLQFKCYDIIYFTPPFSYKNFVQSAKRIHRQGQSNDCNYYLFDGGFEKLIYDRLTNLQKITDEVFIYLLECYNSKERR